MSIYGRLFQPAFRAWESAVRGRPTLEHLDRLERTQWLPLDELRAIQLGELRRLVRHCAAHVPFYRGRLGAPDALRTVEDLQLLPLLTKAGARAAGDQRKSTAPPRCDFAKSTGGTSGEPLVFGYDRGSEHWRQATKLRGWHWSGYRVGDPMLYLWGPPPGGAPPPRQRIKIALDRAIKREVYLDCTLRDEELMSRAVELIASKHIERLGGFTQALVDLARFVVERGLRRWSTLPVLCMAERLFPADRALLIEAFGSSVFETYGCREVMLIGSECHAHDGLHLSMENLIVELLVRDGDRVRAAEPGELGEVAITDLHNYGMPFLRYLNGDLAVAAPPGRCRCGRELTRLASVEGRVAEAMRDAKGARVCGILFSRIFSMSTALAAAVRHWQAVQHKDGRVTVRLELQHPLDGDGRDYLRRSFQRYLPGLDVRTEEVAAIPSGKNGKRQTVIVEAA